MNYWLLLFMLCLWLYSEKSSVFVSADYVIEVELESFSNPSNRRLTSRFNGECCDQVNSTDCPIEAGQCDTYLIHCLRELDTNIVGCPDGIVLESEHATDSNFIKFSQPTALGLPNPFTLSGLSPIWQGVQLYIEVFDFNNNSFDNRLNVYNFNIELPVGNRTEINSAGFTQANTILSLNVTVLCAPFYSGEECQTLDNCGFNAVTCSGRGVCVDGQGNYTCDCDSPYFGRNCEQENFCFERNCSGRGTCQDNGDSYTCSCDPGYTGVDCSVDIDECLSMGPVVCSGRGNCSQGIDYFNCSCDPGYTGERCEVDIDDCVAVNCSGNGVCVDGVNSLKCQCGSGFTGDLCSDTASSPTGTSPRGAPGGVVEGVVSAVVVLILLASVLVFVLVALFLIKRSRREKSIQHSQNVPQSSSFIPGDNPVYGIPEHKTATLTSEVAEFDNPIYGSDIESEPADGDSKSIELDNPIYGDADFEDDTVHVYEQTDAVVSC